MFAPAEDIGLIVVMKNMIHQTRRRYDTMPVMLPLWRGEAHGCPVVLGSHQPLLTIAKERVCLSYLIVFLNNLCQR